MSGYSLPLQLVQRTAAVPLAVDDLRSLGAEEQESAVRRWLEAEKGRPFDWSAAPLFRLQVHRLSAERFQFSLSFHHAILDGWSVATLLAELFTQYAALGGGAASGCRRRRTWRTGTSWPWKGGRWRRPRRPPTGSRW